MKLVQAKDLSNKDLIGKSDPYAVVFIRPLPNKTKKTKTIVRKSPFTKRFSYLFFYLADYMDCG